MTNPLLITSGLPAFSHIKPEHVLPAMEHLLAENRARVEALLDAHAEYTWENLIDPIEKLDERLSRTWSPVSHMNSVVNSDELRRVYNDCLPLLSAYASDMGQNERLYKAYKQIADSAQYRSYEPAQKKIIDNALRDFRLSGVDLDAVKKNRYKEIMQELSALSAKFEENVLDATHAWEKHLTDESLLAGVPESARAMAAQAAQEKGLQGWLFTLDFPFYYPIITYADMRELRAEMYQAYVTRASDQGPNAGQWDNTPLMENMLALRHELAQLLGFPNYAARSLATKMATRTDQVLMFLQDLAARSKKQAHQELKELREFAAQCGAPALEAWDVPYYAEKLRQQKFSISQEELKPYFPQPQVVAGMFAIVKKLFGIDIREKPGLDVWHKDVEFFEIFDAQNVLRGQFYLDLFARAHKRGGAWMDECQTRMQTHQGTQTPVAFLTCNFSPPVGDQPALLTHDEVETLFHEFGHGLHHMLTQVNYAGVAGISGVPWDAVELPSQFLENWCWHREALELISGHFKTGEKLPAALFDKMLAAKHFQSAMQMLRQLEFSIFDFRLHLEYAAEKGGRIFELLDAVRNDIAVVKPPSFNRFPHSFSHIFAGGYAAGYYSYKWAEVLSADAFSLFEERGVFDQATGRKFLQNILELGGSREPMELFVAFRGREPQIDALLRHSGIFENAA
ncbi:MAG: oligopeptidase A [Pseudomonadota bacterium]